MVLFYYTPWTNSLSGFRDTWVVTQACLMMLKSITVYHGTMLAGVISCPSDDMRLSDGNCTESCGGSQQGLCGGFSYHIRQRTYSIYDTIPAVNDQKDESKASPINTNTENGIASASLLKALRISVWSLLSYSSAHGKGNTTDQAAIHEPVANFYRLADTINASLQYLASLAFKSTSQEDDDPVQELEL
ncbi:hypothetical protein ACLX1H_004677 [Fusarium chlamydosporum]